MILLGKYLYICGIQHQNVMLMNLPVCMNVVTPFFVYRSFLQSHFLKEHPFL